LPSKPVVQNERLRSTPALLAGGKVRNVSSCGRTRPIDAPRESVRVGLKLTQNGLSNARIGITSVD
jgi:hypothetical protein